MYPSFLALLELHKLFYQTITKNNYVYTSNIFPFTPSMLSYRTFKAIVYIQKVSANSYNNIHYSIFLRLLANIVGVH